MQENVETTISKLRSRELRAVVSAFPEVAKDRLKTVYATDPSAWAELQRINEARASLVLKVLAPPRCVPRNLGRIGSGNIRTRP